MSSSSQPAVPGIYCAVPEMPSVPAMNMAGAAHLLGPRVVCATAVVVKLSFWGSATAALTLADPFYVGREILALADVGTRRGSVARAIAGRAPTALFLWFAKFVQDVSANQNATREYQPVFERRRGADNDGFGCRLIWHKLRQVRIDLLLLDELEAFPLVDGAGVNAHCDALSLIVFDAAVGGEKGRLPADDRVSVSASS